ncbi:MAG: hypothetical protein RMJ05_10340 [Thermomicrobium sp.]|nr:hypothetical protein [Thermomicrobium sp.]
MLGIEGKIGILEHQLDRPSLVGHALLDQRRQHCLAKPELSVVRSEQT